MNQYQIASLSLKLLGIYSIIEAIPLLRELSQVFAWRGSGIQMEGGPIQTDLLLLGILISFGLLILVGICLILFSKSLARRITTKGEIITETTELTARNIQSIAFSVVGLVMIVIAIPHLVQLAANLQVLKNAGSEAVKRDISIGTWVYSIGIAAQFIIGVLLFFGSRGLSSLWYFFQKLRPMKEL
ncbi:MAG: hypothetical protein WC769_05190 [Thermodesulfovibrionales bacterium]|jgi:hypothetical protein